MYMLVMRGDIPTCPKWHVYGCANAKADQPKRVVRILSQCPMFRVKKTHKKNMFKETTPEKINNNNNNNSNSLAPWGRRVGPFAASLDVCHLQW